MTMRWLIILTAVTLGAPGAVAETRYPAADRPWTQDDYVNFYFVHYNGHQALPHLRDAAAKAVFTRLVDRAEIERIVAAPLTDGEKLRRVALILSITGEARGAYNYAVGVGEPLTEELTQVQVFALFLVDVSVRLATASPGGSPRNAAWKTTLFGVVQSLSERDTYSYAQRRTLADAIAQHYPGIGMALDAAERREFRHSVEILLAAETDADMRAAHVRLLRAADP